MKGCNSGYFLCKKKKKVKMFTVGEMATNSPHAKCRELQLYNAVKNRVCISVEDICCQP